MVSSVGLTDAVVDGGLWDTVVEVSLNKGGGLRVGLRARHESAELTVSVKLEPDCDDEMEVSVSVDSLDIVE